MNYMSEDKTPKLSSSIKKELQVETRLTYSKLIWPIVSVLLVIGVGYYLFITYELEKAKKNNIEIVNPEDKIKNKPEVKSEEAVPTPAATAPATEDYTVKDGDTLGSIAMTDGGLTSADIIAVNPGLVAESLQIGQVIKIPKK